MLLYWPMTEEEYNLLPAHVKEGCIGLEHPENRQTLEGMYYPTYPTKHNY